MTSADKLPALRPLDIFPFEGPGGAPQFALQDNSRIAPQPLAVGVPGYFVLAHLDGRHAIPDIQRAFAEQFQQMLPAEEISKLVAALDENLMLQTDNYERAYAAAVEDYRAAPTRDNRESWPEARELRPALERLLAEAQPAAKLANLAAVVAPHLDYGRGAPCYQQAYALIKAAGPFDRYVILGTNHGGRSRAIVATGKDFETPLGVIATDRLFLDQLEAKLNESVRSYELDHRWEHSVELQVHLLQALQSEHPFQIVPLLCPDVCGPTGTCPPDGAGPDLKAVGAALRELIANDDQRTLIIAGADLSHVGQHFGEQTTTDAAFLEKVARHDQALLGLLTRRQEEDFVTTLARIENPTRICSAGCIYTALTAAPEKQCTLLHYHQATNFEAETHVTCAALAIHD